MISVFDGDLKELEKLVEGLKTAEWWPPIIGDLEDSWRDVGAEATVALIFTAAMVWLAQKARAMAVLFRSFEPGKQWSVVVSGKEHCGPSPLKAVIAAVRSVD